MNPIILPIKNNHPKIDKTCFIAPNATIIGDVILEKNCSVWFNAVIRGDVNSIRIGKASNIQDGAIIHCTYQKSKTIIGKRVTIGHLAIVHGCEIQDEVLIGMGAKILDHTIVEKHCIVAAGAVVLENSHLESGWIYGGIPAKKLKKVSLQQIQNMKQTAQNYIKYSSWIS